MFSLDVLKNIQVQNNPWDHIVIENYIDNEQAIQLSKTLQDTYDWEYDTHPDMKGCVRVAQDKKGLEYFSSHDFCKVIVEKFKCNLPDNYLSTQTNTWHTQGASLPAHTDMHCLPNTNKKMSTDYTNCLTWQLYLPDTNQYPDSGVWLHGEWNDGTKSREKVKQIQCYPGMFFAYINTDKSYHSVPEQNDQFNRVSHMGRIYW
tara:strand:+ start:6980 stop:7588 length:609 start_codon:yes stop_codon:yes gene_type:complete